MRRPFSIILGLAVCAGCSGDDQGSSADGTGGESGSITSETGATSETGESGSVETGETGETGPLLVGEPTIVFHPNQPMVVDVLVELSAPGTGVLTHPDAEIGVFQLAPSPGTAGTNLQFRVRGLLPAAVHELALTVEEADGDRSDSWAGEFTTGEALPGFIAKFQIATVDATQVSGDRRLFDMTKLFSTEPSGVFLVDNEGTTRWYLGDVDEFTDLEDIFTGLRLRPDGSVSFMRRDAAWVVDELGEVQMQVDAEAIGATDFHHDLTELPNGNFITLSYSFADVDYGNEGTLHIAGDVIYEFTPAGELVWSWDSLDHLDPQRRRDGFFIPQKIEDPDTGEDSYDWTHANGLVYTEVDDTIYMSLRHQDWVLAIDHGTGEIRWHLGDEGDFSLVGDSKWFFHQHSVEWQPDGSLMLYDNAVGNPNQPDSAAHSRAVRYALDLDAMTATKLWADDDSKFVSAVAGDADRMSNGAVLRLDSTFVDADNPMASSRLHELDPGATPNLVWALAVAPGRFSYRAVPVDRWVGEPSP